MSTSSCKGTTDLKDSLIRLFKWASYGSVHGFSTTASSWGLDSLSWLWISSSCPALAFDLLKNIESIERHDSMFAFGNSVRWTAARTFHPAQGNRSDSIFHYILMADRFCENEGTLRIPKLEVCKHASLNEETNTCSYIPSCFDAPLAAHYSDLTFCRTLLLPLLLWISNCPEKAQKQRP